MDRRPDSNRHANGPGMVNRRRRFARVWAGGRAMNRATPVGVSVTSNAQVSAGGCPRTATSIGARGR